MELSKSAELQEENSRLSQELQDVKNELKSVHEKLSAASVEGDARLSATSLSKNNDKDIIEENTRLRTEIFRLQEELGAYESRSTRLRDLPDTSSAEHRIRVLEKEIDDWKHENELLKEKLQEREKDVLKSRQVLVSVETDLSDLEVENNELRDKLEDLETEEIGRAHV